MQALLHSQGDRPRQSYCACGAHRATGASMARGGGQREVKLIRPSSWVKSFLWTRFLQTNQFKIKNFFVCVPRSQVLVKVSFNQNTHSEWGASSLPVSFDLLMTHQKIF